VEEEQIKGFKFKCELIGMNNQRFNLQSFALGHESSKKFTLINLNFLKHENGQLSIISQINEMKTKRSELCDNKKLYY